MVLMHHDLVQSTIRRRSLAGTLFVVVLGLLFVVFGTVLPGELSTSSGRLSIWSDHRHGIE